MENGVDKVTRVLFCGFEHPASHSYTQKYLENCPFIKIDVLAHVDVPDCIHKYHVCVVKMFRLDSQMIARAVKMKLIIQFGVGLEGVDIVAASQHNIKVARIPGKLSGNSKACAEMAIYLILGLLRKKKEMEESIQRKIVGQPLGDTLFGKNVFIVGFGDIGYDLAKILRGFGVKILATKRKWNFNSNKQNGSTNDNDDRISDKQIDAIGELVDIKGSPQDYYQFAAEADIVVLCLTLNSETAGIINKEFLSSMKKGSMLVNIARGGVVDYKSVYESLKSGHLGGLAMDVAWQEPFDPQDPILKLPNVIITPHVAGVTELSYTSMAKIVGDCAIQLHNGHALKGIQVVN
ncbi:D-3-phosphoglycerate dehydrogenase-like [Dioscorea cayenensis subsp. rotundata]|uniref:D-3-phosphoglycerate dehydrogenase-like n=1 Tax=Dioscorea cayennensis subsp. rotundata TaxID=55577 RepID=A0AB40BEI6_DIOCR|nr:D-3-phosphoglycerate dehydrogenase-like [Dioscorea cayenensis subsp. rotundata]